MIIALTGSKGSGKDLFYNVIKREYPQLDIRKIAFADPIKDQIMHIFNLKTESEYDKFKRTDVNFKVCGSQHVQDGRHIVREIGMMMRNYDVNQFTNYVQGQISANPKATWVVTDLRFDNELALLKKLDAIVIKIKRTDCVYDGHVTETEFPDEECSSVIMNDGGLNDYEAAIKNKFANILQTLSGI